MCPPKVPEVRTKSVLSPFSIIAPVSAESDAVSFSPETNVPITLVSATLPPLVAPAYTSPVAPEVTPVIFTQPVVCVAVSNGEGVL